MGCSSRAPTRRSSGGTVLHSESPSHPVTPSFSIRRSYPPATVASHCSPGGNAQLALFRPKVDEISLLTVNTTDAATPTVSSGGYMVAFAGRKYAARSLPALVGNSTFIVTSFTLILEFQKGTLQNLYWKRDGCSSCSGVSSAFVCLNNEDCAIKTSSCKGQGGSLDCSLRIQMAFSGTDKHSVVLNSWYEVSNLQQYSLVGLYSNLRDQYNKLF